MRNKITLVNYKIGKAMLPLASILVVFFANVSVLQWLNTRFYMYLC